MIYSVTTKSAGRLASLLNVSIKHPFGGGRSRFDKDVVRIGNEHCPNINYGLEKKYIPKNVRDNIINFHAENSSDKLFCFKTFDKVGVPHPPIIDPESYDGFFLGRRNFASRGFGITKFKPRSENYQRNKNSYDFCVAFINSVAEYRVHVWDGNIIIETEKDFSNNTHPFIRNSIYGSVAKLGYIRHNRRLEILDAAILAVKSIGLNFAAVDIIIDEQDNYYILECNSGPLLIGVNTFFYAEFLTNRFNLNVRKWWTFNKSCDVIIDNSEFYKRYET